MGEVKPIRLKLSRVKGFNLQEHSLAANGLPAVRVARPGRFGNPFTLEMAYEVEDTSREDARDCCVAWFREWITQPADHHDQSEDGAYGWLREDRSKLLAGLPSLRGKNLACFCAKGTAWNPVSCHADVLLELANGPLCDEPRAPTPSRQESKGGERG